MVYGLPFLMVIKCKETDDNFLCNDSTQITITITITENNVMIAANYNYPNTASYPSYTPSFVELWSGHFLSVGECPQYVLLMDSPIHQIFPLFGI